MNDISFGDNGLMAPTVTTGNLTVGCIQTWPWDNSGGTLWPQTTIYSSWPQWCSGNVHVFGCDHAEKCQCGKSKRKVSPPKCAHCGKEHV